MGPPGLPSSWALRAVLTSSFTSYGCSSRVTHPDAGVSGNSRFRDSREYKPQISLPFPWHFIISRPVPGKRNFWPGIKTGNTIIICSFVDGWSRHENKSNLEFSLAFYMIPGISRDSRDYEPQISLPLP